MSTVSSPRARCKPHTDRASLQADFATILPRIETHARIYFRRVKCDHKKADRVADTVAIAWKWFVRLAERGKDATQFPSMLASLAARAVCSGRRVTGQSKAKDVMNERTQERRGFYVGKLPEHDVMEGSPFLEALYDNRYTPPGEQAAFRIDFPEWQRTRTDRDRRLMTNLAMGERTGRVAQLFGLSPSRVSILRRDFKTDWERFCE